MAHPASTTAPAGPDPVKDLTDGAQQLAINQAEQPQAQPAKKQQKAQQPKKDKKGGKDAAASTSSRPVEVSQRVSERARVWYACMH